MESVESSSKSPLTQKKLSEQSVDDNALGKPEKPQTKAVHATPKKSIVVDGTALELETPEKLNLPPRVQNRVGKSGKDVKKKSLSFHGQELDESDTDSSSEGELEDEERSSSDDTHRLKSVEASDKLPEKSEMLCQFFCTMSSLIPLIRMRRMPPTFANISPKLESLTGRMFSITHLTQLRCILPEAILIKRIRSRDEQSECMKEDLHITIDRNALKFNEHDQDLKTVVRACIQDYLKSHSEEDVWELDSPDLLFHHPNQKNKLSSVETGFIPASHKLPIQTSLSRKV